MVFQPLYKKTKTGAIQLYQISVDNDTYKVVQGQLEGKKQEYITSCSPKNIGKSNESTAQQQAESEAQSKFAEKVKSGYTTNPSGEITIQLPMKISTYQDHISKVQSRCYVSPKLNGVNATYTLLPDDSLILTSRGGEIFPALPHLEPIIRYMLKHFKTDRIAGELYMHGFHLQDIMSYVVSTKPESTGLQFHIFDLPNIYKPYSERRQLLDTYTISSTVFIVPAVVCNSSIAIEEQFVKWTSYGYEGLVLTLPEALYQYNVRSLQVFKYKKALDAEYLVVDYTIDKSGSPVLVCETPEKRTFSVKPKGTVLQRQQLLDNLEACIGRWYKIEYETLSKLNIPLKPVGICFRNCDASGNPLE